MCLSSVYRSQGQTLRKTILDIRRPPGNKLDTAAMYVALSRATGLDDINMLFPITLEDLNRPPNQDVVAIVNYLGRLDRASFAVFMNAPGTFTPASASLDTVADVGPKTPKKQRRKTTGKYGRGATRRVAHLLPNDANNCFFNSALALALAGWDGQPLPVASEGTPAAASFFGTLQLLRDCMFDGSSVPSSVQVSARASRGFIFTNSGLPGAGAQMGAVASVFEGVVRACPENGSYLWPQDLGDQRRRVVSTRRAFGLDWRYSNNCGIGDHSSREVTPDQSASLRNATVITIPNGSSASFQEKVLGVFSSGLTSDLSIPGESPCPSCADCVQQTLCDWTLLSFTAVTAPDRLFLRSSSVFQGLAGLPMSASLTLTMGVEYSLVGVSYHFAVGGVERNHFISQLRVRGRWHK
ncbi:unnamed protein product [Scytosiphon promiscuus]